MRKDKWKPEEKVLCEAQNHLILEHIKICSICKTPYDEYQQFGISNTPMCKKFEWYLKEHISRCSCCQEGNKKWNNDAITITNDMRVIVGELKKGKLPDVDLMKKTALHLFKELNMSSFEIKKASELAEEKVRKELERG